MIDPARYHEGGHGTGKPGYGQAFYYRDGMVSVEGCGTPEAALWRAAHMLFHSNLTRRQVRKAMPPELRRRLIAIAKRKLTG